MVLRPAPPQTGIPQRCLQIICADSINTLPNETLLNVIRCLIVNHKSHLTDDSARDLASVARTCRRFHELATPFLYSQVTVSMWARCWPKAVWLYPPDL